MIERWKETVAMWIAWHALPRRVVMWCAYRVGANATQGAHSHQVVPDLLFMDAMKRWDIEHATAATRGIAGEVDNRQAG